MSKNIDGNISFFQHQLNTHLFWRNTHPHTHLVDSTNTQSLSRRLAKVFGKDQISHHKVVYSFIAITDFLTRMCSITLYKRVCFQFYSILDGDVDMLFMHVDNPGGNTFYETSLIKSCLTHICKCCEENRALFMALSAPFVVMENVNGKSRTGLASSLCC